MFSNSAGRGKKRTERAHRWSYAYLRCEIPAGLEIDHLCRNRGCVNPWHLEPVTPLVNWERGISPWRLNDLKDRCHQGHPFTPDNTYYHPAGSRVCRRCRAMHQQRYDERQTQKRRAA
ncbi:HNH endonuclease [Streptomyces sp. NPDC002125]